MADSTQTKRVPAWKRLGLTLTRDGKTNVQGKGLPQRPASASNMKSGTTITPDSKKRKFVAFAQDTKAEDGNRTGNELKNFFASQNGGRHELTSQEVTSFTLFDSHPGNQSLPKTASNPVRQAEVTMSSTTTKKGRKSQIKVQNPAGTALSNPTEPPAFLRYLRQFHEDRSNWKFNKVKQNHILRHAFNMAIISPEDEAALYAYCKSVQSDSARRRLLTEARDIVDKDEARAAKARSTALKRALLEEKVKNREIQDEINADDEQFEGNPKKRKRAQEILDFQCNIWKSTSIDIPGEALKDASTPINSVYTMIVDKNSADAAGNPIKKRRRVTVRSKKVRTGFLEDDVESVSSISSDHATNLAGPDLKEESDDDSEVDGSSESTDSSDDSDSESSSDDSDSESSRDGSDSGSSSDDGRTQATTVSSAHSE